MNNTPIAASTTATSLSPALLSRIRGEFLEMPGLRLTPAQAVRLFGVSDQLARGLLQALTEERFLVCRDDHSYVRWASDVALGARPAQHVHGE